MKFEVTIKTKDLRRAIREIGVNRGRHSETDFTDILVSEFSATFRSVGTETEVPVNGIEPGSARVPFAVLKRLARVVGTFKGNELRIICEPGCLKVERFAIKHPDIELGVIPDQRLSIPIDLSLLDTLALGRVLTPQQIVEQSLRERIEEAQRGCSEAIARAVSALQPLGIDEKQVTALIEEHLTHAAARMRRAIGEV
jgi:hypothetical protein